MPDKFLAALVLNNLTKEYNYLVAIITQQLKTTLVINLEVIFNQLIDKSKQLNLNNFNKNNNNVYNNVEMSLNNTSNYNNKNYNNKTSNSNKICNFCNKKRHLI